ncbi:hypothetical protein ACWEOZ_27875 [Actinoplanes sp. NPDC004185]
MRSHRGPGGDHYSVARHQSRPAEECPERGGAIQALDHDVLVRRSLEISSSCFTTIIGILQGVALAILADNTFNDPSPLAYFHSVCLALVLVGVFYTYVNMSIMLRWAPSFLDSFMPFMIAGLEIPPAYFLGQVAAWNTWLGMLWLGAATGFYVNIKWSPASHFGKEHKAHRIFHRMYHELMLTSLACGLAMGFFGLAAHLYPAAGSWLGVAGVVTVLATMAIFVARSEIGSAQIHARFGVHRPPFN